MGGAMRFIGRLFLAFGVLRIGGLQGRLIYNIHHLGVDDPRVQRIIGEIGLAAWKMRNVSGFFQGIGFSFDDYLTMYHAAIRACPNMLLKKKNLVATFLLIDRFANLDPAFRAYSQAVSDQTGTQRAQGLTTLIGLMVNDVVQYKASELSPIEKYPFVTR
jgi:hypothetical protein